MEELNPKHQNSSNMTVLQFFDNGEISSMPRGRPNTPVMGMSNNRSENETLQSNESSEDLSRANENYVKRVMSGFLVVSKPKSRESEDRHHRRYRNQNEEPEWFHGTSAMSTCRFAITVVIASAIPIPILIPIPISIPIPVLVLAAAMCDFPLAFRSSRSTPALWLSLALPAFV